MGEKIRYECKKCGYSFEASLGFGFRYPSQFRSTVEAARKGAFGKEYRCKILLHERLLERNAAIDLTCSIARCMDCGKYQTISDNTLYAVPKRKFYKPRIWTGSVKEYFITPDEMRRYGKVIGKIDHRCSYCKGELQIIGGVPDELACPECGSMMTRELEALFD